MRLAVEKGQIYRCHGLDFNVIDVEIDAFEGREAAVWVWLQEILDLDTQEFTEKSPLYGFKRGEPFTSYCQPIDGQWQLAKGYKLVGGESIITVPAVEPKPSSSRSKTDSNEVGVVTLPKKRGRPPGSKNKGSENKASTGCAEHPKYKGKRRPRSGCKICQRIYDANQSDKLGDSVPGEQFKPTVDLDD